MGKVDKINEIIRINEINRVSRIKRIHRINGIKSSHQQNIYCMCTLLRIFSVVYILRDPRTNFFFCYLLRKQKEKKKPVFWLLIKMRWFFLYWKAQKMTRLKPPRQILTLHKTVQHGKVILQKRVFLMHRLPLLLFVFSLFSLYPFPLLNAQPKKKKIILSLVPQYIYYWFYVVHKLSTVLPAIW